MPPSPQKPKAKRSYRPASETRQLIFDTALSLMVRHGFQGATVRDICATTGVSVGTFYQCYASKADILRSIYAQSDNFFLEVVTQEAAQLPIPRQLEIFVRHYAKLNSDTGLDVMRVLFNPENQWFAQPRPMQNVLLNMMEQGQQEGLLTLAFSAQQLVDYLFDILRGICYNWCVSGGAFDLEERMLGHFQLFFQSISAQP